MEIPIAGILTVVCSFLAKAGIIAAAMGIMTRCLNYLIRAFSGKEDFL